MSAFIGVLPYQEKIDKHNTNSYFINMKNTTTVSERGQITIPKSLRDSMGIRPGQTLAVREVRGEIVITKEISEDKWDRVIGILDSGQTTDEIMEELRGPVDTCD